MAQAGRVVPIPDRSALEAQARAQIELAKREQRVRILSSTERFGVFTGSNAYNTQSGRYPWMEPQLEVASYLDKMAFEIGLPLKPVALPRAHLKTEVGCHALLRRAMLNPELRNCIIGATEDRALSNLANLRSICESQEIQELYSVEKGGPLPLRGTNAYTANSIVLHRTGNYREDSIEAMGRSTSMVGKHYNGVIWIDDIVNEQDNFENGEVTQKVMRLLSHIMEYVADPGCEIWITYTRYHPADPYGIITDPEGEFAPSIVKPAICKECFVHHDNGSKTALFPFKFCMFDHEKASKDPQVGERERDDVPFNGKVYPDVVRKSLVQMQRRTDPAEFHSQMLNRPMAGAGVGFDGAWFDSVLPVIGEDLLAWLEDGCWRDMVHPDGRRVLGDFKEQRLLVTHIIGDPSYRKGRANDFATLFAVSQLLGNHFVVRDAFRARLGFQGDIKYAERALNMKEVYSARGLGIEAHARESLETVFQFVAKEQGRTVKLHPLPANSNVAKKDRIATLIPITSESRLHWCMNTDKVRLATRAEAEAFPGCCDGNGLHDDCLDGLANMTQLFRARKHTLADEIENDLSSWRSRTPDGVRRFLGA